GARSARWSGAPAPRGGGGPCLRPPRLGRGLAGRARAARRPATRARADAPPLDRPGGGDLLERRRRIAICATGAATRASAGVRAGAAGRKSAAGRRRQATSHRLVVQADGGRLSLRSGFPRRAAAETTDGKPLRRT